MSTTLRNIAITVALAVVAAGGGAWVCAHYVVSHHAAGSSLHDVVHHDLHLSADQDRRIEAIEARYAVQRRALEAEMRTANRELAAAIQQGHEDSPAVEAAIDHLHHVMGRLQKATIAHVFDMRAVLTPAQAKKFDAEVVEALTDGDR